MALTHSKSPHAQSHPLKWEDKPIIIGRSESQARWGMQCY